MPQILLEGRVYVSRKTRSRQRDGGNGPRPVSDLSELMLPEGLAESSIMHTTRGFDATSNASSLDDTILGDDLVSSGTTISPVKSDRFRLEYPEGHPLYWGSGTYINGPEIDIDFGPSSSLLKKDTGASGTTTSDTPWILYNLHNADAEPTSVSRVGPTHFELSRDSKGRSSVRPLDEAFGLDPSVTYPLGPSDYRRYEPRRADPKLSSLWLGLAIWPEPGCKKGTLLPRCQAWVDTDQITE